MYRVGRKTLHTDSLTQIGPIFVVISVLCRRHWSYS